MAARYRAQHLYFNTDLCKQAVHYLDFLKTVYNVPDLKQPEILRRAVYRYERFWLPLAAEHPEECLVAPLDIEWIWHCHMLYPEAYDSDCHKIVGTKVNHTLYSRNEFLEEQKTSEKCWSQKYRSESEPFTIDRNIKYDAKEPENYHSKISIDIVAEAQKQFEFYYQVSLPHYYDIQFLENSLLRYKQFLYLKKVTQEFLIPSCDIDLIRRTHLLNPAVYKEDMVRIVGHLLNPDETFHNHSDDSKLHSSEKETEEIWKIFFHEKYSLLGAMYRGLPSIGRLYNTNRDDVYLIETKSCKVTLEKLTLNLCSGKYRKVKVTGLSVKDGSSINKLFTLKHMLKSSSEADTVTWTDVGSFELDTKSIHGIGFQLRLWLGRLCCSSTETSIRTNVIEILQFLDDKSSAVTGGKLNSRAVFDNASLDIQGLFSPVECEKTVLFLKRGRYHNSTITDHALDLCGPVAIEKCPSEMSKTCQVATHSLNHLVPGAYNMEITVKTIHSNTLPLSAIQVFYNDKMAAVAHVIASDQLPLPTQVTKDEITLDPVHGDKAVIIKNCKGDWGIVLGRWTDLRDEVRGPGCKCDTAIRDNPGSLSVKFYKCATEVTTNRLIERHSNSCVFSLESAEIDLKKGTIRIDTLQREIAENIAMAFSVSLLHVLCAPTLKLARKVDTIDCGVNTQEMKLLPCDEMAFLLAAGSTLDIRFVQSN